MMIKRCQWEEDWVKAVMGNIIWAAGIPATMLQPRYILQREAGAVPTFITRERRESDWEDVMTSLTLHWSVVILKIINIYIKGLGLIPDSDIPPRQQNISWLFSWKMQTLPGQFQVLPTRSLIRKRKSFNKISWERGSLFQGWGQ